MVGIVEFSVDELSMVDGYLLLREVAGFCLRLQEFWLFWQQHFDRVGVL